MNAAFSDVSSFGLSQAGVRTAPPRLFKPRPKDTSIYPGEPATFENLESRSRRDRLIELVWHLVGGDTGRLFAHHDTACLSPDTAAAATQFLALLPRNITEPRIAPNGDGGLELVWTGAQTTIIVVQEWTLHAVKAAGSPEATYVQDVPFSGEVPNEILDMLERGAQKVSESADKMEPKNGR